MTGKTERLYSYLTDEEDARICKDIPESACHQVPGNFLIILIAQIMSQLADALANAKTVLPWILTSAGVPAFYTGLLVPIRESGSLLPQLIIGGFVRQHGVRKWFYVLGSVLQGLCICAIAWSGVYLSGSQAGITIIAMLILFSLSRGLCSVASKDVLGKTIPKTRRGLLSGYCASAAGLITLCAGAILLVQQAADPKSFSWLLLSAAICWFGGALLFARIKEDEGATEGGASAFKAAFKSLSLIKTDSLLRRFIIMRSLMMSSGLAAPYFIILVTQSTGSRALDLGIFIILAGLASLLSGVVWGRFSDLSSRRVMLVTALMTALLCACAGTIASFPASELTGVLAGLFFLLSVTHQGVRLGRKTYLLDISGGNQRTDYVALSNTLIGILLLVAGLASAFIAQLSIASVMFLFSGASALAFLVGLRLPEA